MWPDLSPHTIVSVHFKEVGEESLQKFIFLALTLKAWFRRRATINTRRQENAAEMIGDFAKQDKLARNQQLLSSAVVIFGPENTNIKPSNCKADAKFVTEASLTMERKLEWALDNIAPRLP